MQTDQRICKPLFGKVSYPNLAQLKFQFSDQCISVPGICKQCSGGGGGGGGDKNTRFISNTGPISLKIQSQHLMLGIRGHARDSPSKWCFAGGPMMARF